VAASTYDENGPAYSRDGRRIVFKSTRTGNPELWVSNADGTNLRQVTFLGGPYEDFCRANVEMADYVHDFLTQTSERLWLEHKHARSIRSNRDRRAFLAGVMTGFRDKLAGQKKQNREHGLVWRGDPQLGAYVKERHPRLSWTRYASSQHHAAHAEGRRAGSSIVLHRGLGRSPESRGRLLGSG